MKLESAINGYTFNINVSRSCKFLTALVKYTQCRSTAVRIMEDFIFDNLYLKDILFNLKSNNAKNVKLVFDTQRL